MKRNYAFLLLLLGSQLALTCLNAGVVTTSPAHEDRKIVVAKDESVAFTATPDSGSVTTSLTVDPTGPTISGSGSSQTATFAAGTEGQAYTCTLSVTHTDGDVTCTDGQEFTYTVYVPKITTETIVSTPANADRRKLGVKEEVTITVEPSDLDISWNVSTAGQSAGEVVPSEGTLVQYTASWEANQEATIFATGITNYQEEVVFEVVAPQNVVYQQAEAPGLYNTGGILSIFAKLSLYMTPTDVNFENIKFKEGSCYATAWGYFQNKNGEEHVPNAEPVPITSDLVEGSGWEIAGTDLARTNDNAPDFIDGEFHWYIPLLYDDGLGALQFNTVLQKHVMANPTGLRGTLSLYKSQFSASVEQ